MTMFVRLLLVTIGALGAVVYWLIYQGHPAAGFALALVLCALAVVERAAERRSAG